MFNISKHSARSSSHRLLLAAVLSAALSTLLPLTPASAASPPPQNPGCTTYGCVYEECPGYHSRRGAAPCEQHVVHERLEETRTRRLVATRWPEHYRPDRRHMWDQVAHCESTWRWAIDNGNGYHGGLQFHPRTWRAYGGAEYAAYAHQATAEQQISVGERVAFHGWTAPDGTHHAPQGKGAWPRCGRVLSPPA